MMARYVPFRNANVIREEELYDGFYAVCTNLKGIGIDEIIRINQNARRLKNVSVS